MRIIAAVLAVLLLAGCGAETAAPTQTTIPTQTTGKPLPLAPDLRVYDIDGNAHALSDFRGKPVVLNFWASWCGPCKAEMPDFEESYQTYGDEIHFVVVNLTGGTETVDKASKFIAGQGYTFPVYYDLTGTAAAIYGISSIPSTFFIDADGHVVVMSDRRLSAAALQEGIDMILE